MAGGAAVLDEIIARLQCMPKKERDAVVAEAMKATAGMRWIPNPGPQTDAFHSAADVLLYGGQGGGGKALSLDTAIPTPNGWSSMRDLQPGDRVFDETGAVCNVTACSPVMIGRPCYRVRFSDGTEIVADEEHLWLTMTQRERDAALCLNDEWRNRRRAKRPSRAKAEPKRTWTIPHLVKSNRERLHTYKAPPAGSVRTTAEIAATLTHGTRGGLNHSVAATAALQLPTADLPVEPYVLGAWLGDGSSYKAEMTAADVEVIEQFHAAGYETKQRGPIAYGIYGLLPVLRASGLLANKHIPAIYLRASEAQRLALLQGLMDTDGTAGESGKCEFTTTNWQLAVGFRELAISLGIKTTISVGTATLYGKDCGPKYRAVFHTDKPAFRLGRKLDRQKRTSLRPVVGRRYIEAVEPTASVPVRCIAVDSPSRLYLASQSMIPTHNSDLGLGLAFTEHKRSLILRRKYANLSALTERAIAINGTKNGYNGSAPPLLRTNTGGIDRYIQFGANQHLGDEQDWQGQAFDYKYFDEAVQFLEQQIRFHLGWLRPMDGDGTQRCRAVLGSNPPIDANGDWIIGMFRPWLDITHPKPAKANELRWYVTDPDGKDLEVDETNLGRDDLGRRCIEIDGKKLLATSRTFIPAALADNPFLIKTDYQAKLDALPEPLRSAVRDGNFMAARSDAEWQVIPTAWVIAAQDRWIDSGYKDLRMSAMGFDPAGGGRDSAELAMRYGGWYDHMVSATGAETADGSAAAGTITKHRRDGAPVVVDVGGGYGGAVTLRLKDNEIDHVAFNGAGQSTARTRDGQLRFVNKRAEAWWKFREELDPDQQGGSSIALPPDPELRADLTAPIYMVKSGGIQIESKDDLRKRLGRSPGKGDAVVMAYSEGDRAIQRKLNGVTPRMRGGLQRDAIAGGHAQARQSRFGGNSRVMVSSRGEQG